MHLAVTDANTSFTDGAKPQTGSRSSANSAHHGPLEDRQGIGRFNTLKGRQRRWRLVRRVSQQTANGRRANRDSTNGEPGIAYRIRREADTTDAKPMSGCGPGQTGAGRSTERGGPFAPARSCTPSNAAVRTFQT